MRARVRSLLHAVGGASHPHRNLAALNARGITFIPSQRRTPVLLQEMVPTTIFVRTSTATESHGRVKTAVS